MMRRTLALWLVVALATADAGERMKTLARWSRIALVAASAADVASSYGHQELNPFLRSRDGRFGVRGVSIKLGVLGAWMLIQRRIGHEEPTVVWSNFAASAVLGAVAARNWRVR